MAQIDISVVPTEYETGFFNQEWVRNELGTPVNFSIGAITLATDYFTITGDATLVTVDTMNYIAQSGIKVALIYGDRDYRCNCML